MTGIDSQLSLSLLGYGMVVVFMALIMSRILSAFVALILVPVVFGLIAGHDVDMAMMAIGGVQKLAPTVVALVFAVLYFAIMMDSGLFDPLVRRAIAFAKGDPLRVTLSTVAVTSLISLDGDGATTAIVTIGAFLPIYQRLGMRVLYLGILMGMSNAVLNLTPWGGPTLRAASALQLDVGEVFVPLIPVMLAGLVGVAGIAVYLGLRERKRLGVVDYKSDPTASPIERSPGVERPGRFWFNLAMTLVIMVGIVLQIVPLPIAFMLGFCVALIVNYPRVSEQRERIAAHSENVVPIVLLIFSAGVFTGILSGTGMVDAMGGALLSVVPESLGKYFGAIIALASGPLSFVMSSDAYYFGIVPVFAEAAAQYGVASLEVARASVLGSAIHALSPLIAAIYLVAGLLDVEVGDLQRIGLPFAILVFLIMVAAAFVSGAVPFAV